MNQKSAGLFFGVIVSFFVLIFLVAGVGVGFAAGSKKAMTPPRKIMKKVEKSLASFAVELKKKPSASPESMYAELKGYLEKNPEIYGAAFAYPPENNAGELNCPYVYRQDGKFIEKNISEGYDYTAPGVSWYSEPVKRRKPYWTKPYFDKGGGEIDMITYSIPLYDGQKRLLGVVTSDLPVKR